MCQEQKMTMSMSFNVPNPEVYTYALCLGSSIGLGLLRQ